MNITFEKCKKGYRATVFIKRLLPWFSDVNEVLYSDNGVHWYNLEGEYSNRSGTLWLALREKDEAAKAREIAAAIDKKLPSRFP